jgi:hypothetical protein
MTLGIASVAASTSGGLPVAQALTVDCGGETPKAVVLRVTRGVTLGTAVAGQFLSVGVSDGTATRLTACMAEDGQAATASDSGRSLHSTEIVQILDTTTGAVIAAADFSSFGADTVNISWTTLPASAFLICVEAYHGDDCDAAVGQVSASTTQNGTTTVSGLSFQPTTWRLFGAEFGFGTGTNAHARYHEGAASVDEDSVVTGQWCVLLGDRERSGRTGVISGIRDDAIAVRFNIANTGSRAATELSRVDVQAGTSDGAIFETIQPASPSALVFAYLALRFDTRRSLAWIPASGDLNTSTSGTHSIDDPGWFPDALSIATTRQPSGALNAYQPSGGHGASYGASDGTTHRNIGAQLEDNVSTADTRCITGNALAVVLNDAGGIDHSMSSATFDALGVNILVGTSSSADRLAGFLAIERRTIMVADEPVGLTESCVLVVPSTDLEIISDEAVGLTEGCILRTDGDLVVGEPVGVAESCVLRTDGDLVLDEAEGISEGCLLLTAEPVVFGEAEGISESCLLRTDGDLALGEPEGITETCVLRTDGDLALGEPVGVTESCVLRTDGDLVVVEPVGVDDSCILRTDGDLVVDEPEGITESCLLLAAESGVSITVGEPVGVSEGCVLRTDGDLVLGEPVGVAETCTLRTDGDLVADETEGITESCVLRTDGDLVSTETEGVTDACLIVIKTALGEAEGIAESCVLLAAGVAPGLIDSTEAVGLAESCIVLIKQSVVFGETIGLTETCASAGGDMAEFGEAEGVVDACVLLPLDGMLTLDDTEGLSESCLLIAGQVLTSGDAVGVAEQCNTGRGLIAMKSTHKGRCF